MDKPAHRPDGANHNHNVRAGSRSCARTSALRGASTVRSHHGSKPEVVRMLADGRIDVGRGEGEFGQGFYTQRSLHSAWQWALGRGEAAVLRLDIPEDVERGFRLRILSAKQARALTARLTNKRTRRTYKAGVDVIEGPLNGNERNLQYKFESEHAQSTINGSSVQRTGLFH